MLAVEITGIPEMTARLEGMESRAGDPLAAFEAIYESFRSIEEKRWANEGPGWQALKPATVAEKARRGQHPGILDATGALRASLTGKNAPGSVYEADPTGITMGSDLKTDDGWGLGALHQHGTSRGLPVRKVIDASESHALEWALILRNWITDGVLEGGAVSIVGLGPRGL